MTHEFNKTYFLVSLYRLNSTEISLKSMCKYICMFDDYDTIVDGIEYVHGVSSIHHRLLLYYLCVEIFKQISEKEEYEHFKTLICDFVYRTFGRTEMKAKEINICMREFGKLHNVFEKKSLVRKYE